ncbi:MAG: hypothetical protein FJ405_12085 [Verrucomicrobia bacterium]|nr:hypothetical protein [Verrucomicrobiota bacterium]
MDIIFECPHCTQELSIDAEGAGTWIECPACSKKVQVPEPEAKEAPAAVVSPPAPANRPAPAAPPAELVAGKVINAMASSAGAKESKHFSVPVHEGPTESLIAKPLPTLEVSAKESDRQMRIKSFRHSDHVEVGKDHFDEHLNQFLGKVGEANVIQLNTFTYTHQDLATRAWITDYGVLVIYRG